MQTGPGPIRYVPNWSVRHGSKNPGFEGFIMDTGKQGLDKDEVHLLCVGHCLIHSNLEYNPCNYPSHTRSMFLVC